MTGSGGMLGASVYPALCAKFSEVLATDIDLNEPWLSKLDVRDLHECERAWADYRPTIVFHLAALTDLEACERDPENCWLTNALGTENIALLARRSGSTLVYVSTAGIFDGKQREYHDFDAPNPLSVYAKGKYHGECFIERYLTDYYVFRAGWMMGGGPDKDKKFINKIYRQIRSGTQELFVVTDKLGTPTYTRDFADNMLRVLETGRNGLYNQACVGGGSRYDVAVEFVRLLGLAERVRVPPVTSDYFGGEYFAERPASDQLITLKLDARGMNGMRHWKECLAEYSRYFLEDYHGRL